ncbi:MAG: VWA domain-containing protein [Rhodobacteraceae bacterium]|nr:MAG: VWA domain-containing protein [Paracoccaceae bacterium]
MIPSTFHFLRPEWLLALIPAALIVALVARRITRAGSGEWAGLVDSHLLRHLAVQGEAGRGTRWWLTALGAGLVAAVLAMAGPTWQRLPTPVYGGSDPTVVVLSLAQSMNGTDLVPSRLARAGHKLRDILNREKGDEVALVIYADRPFVAAPLTSDTAVIREMLPELSTDLMPVLGNRLDLAIAEAQDLLAQAGAASGRIVVMADDMGLDADASLKAAEAARKASYTVSVLGIGTEAGADLQTARGRAITGKDGSAITARLDLAGLARLAEAGGGAFSTVTADGRDIAAVLPDAPEGLSAPGAETDMVSDSWNDVGYWLLLIPVLLAPFAFRRGLLLALPLAFLGLGMAPQGVSAGTLGDLLKTPDQQGQAAFDAGDYAAAAREFASPAHRAAALYRAGDFAAAAETYASLPRASEAEPDDYNLGNALAKAGRFEEALAAYDKALAVDPEDGDAQFNRDLVAKLLEQQDQQQQQDQQDQQQSGQQDQQDSGQQDQQDSGKDGNQPQDAQQDQQGQQEQAQDGKQSGDQQGAQPDQSQANSGAPEDRQAGQTPQGAEPDDAGAPKATTDARSGEASASETDQTSGSETERQTNRQAETDASGDNPLTDLLNDLLSGTPTNDPADQDATAQSPGPVLDQAAEQQLRAVPDDPTGLLRARIRQHYAQRRANGQ